MNGEGIQAPIKAVAKNDTVGLGSSLSRQGGKGAVKKEQVQLLDAGKVRQEAEDARRRGEKLREAFYSRDDVEAYLAGG